MRLFKLHDTTALSRVYIFDFDDFVYGMKEEVDGVSSFLGFGYKWGKSILASGINMSLRWPELYGPMTEC